MPITLVGSTSGSAINGLDVTLTMPGGVQENDVVLIVGGHPARTGAGLGPAELHGFSLIAQRNFAVDGATSPNSGAWYKVVGAVPDVTITCAGTGNSSDPATYILYVFRGVNPSSVQDAVATTATGNSTNPDCPSINVSTNGAWVIAHAAANLNDSTVTGPAGYSNFLSTRGVDTSVITIMIATKQVAPGVENPPAFTDVSNTTWWGVTIALRPAGSFNPSGYKRSGIM